MNVIAYNKKRTYAFTLAEVLITLVIIGVVAALTVPTVVANSQEKAIKASLKKNYSIIQDALKKYYLDNGEHVTTSTNFSKDFFFKYFNLAKNCRIDSCGDFRTIRYKNYNGGSFDGMEAFRADTGVMLSDGSYISYHYRDMGEDRYYGYAGGVPPHWGISLYIDVNGHKKPNMLGRDLFSFDLVLEYQNGKSGNSQLIPVGQLGTYYNYNDFCSKNSTHVDNGMGCAYKILFGK